MPLDELRRRIVRQRGAIATLITNGYLLTPELICKLDAAGLDSMQVSIDNLAPNDVSKKSLKLLDPKLRWFKAPLSGRRDVVVGRKVCRA